MFISSVDPYLEIVGSNYAKKKKKKKIPLSLEIEVAMK
jgi:hypothetical protein